MEFEFTRQVLQRKAFTIWVKAVLHETANITLKFSASPRLRASARDIGSARRGHARSTDFSRVKGFMCTSPIAEICDVSSGESSV